MVSKGWASALALLLLSLAGCSDDGGEGGESSTSSTSEDPATSSSTTTTSRSSTTTSSSSSTTSSSTNTTTTGPAGNSTGNQTGNATGPAPVTFTGSYQSGSAGLCALGLTGGVGGSAGAEADVTYANIDFGGEDFSGQPFTVTYAFTVPSAGLVIGFPDDSGSFAGSESDAPSQGSTTLSGTVPDGAVGAFASSCGGGGVTVTLVIG